MAVFVAIVYFPEGRFRYRVIPVAPSESHQEPRSHVRGRITNGRVCRNKRRARRGGREATYEQTVTCIRVGFTGVAEVSSIRQVRQGGRTANQKLGGQSFPGCSQSAGRPPPRRARRTRGGRHTWRSGVEAMGARDLGRDGYGRRDNIREVYASCGSAVRGGARRNLSCQRP